MMNKEACERERLIRRQASSWYWKLKDPNLTERDHEEWQRWQTTPEHQKAFDAVSADWKRWRKMPWPWRTNEQTSQAHATRTAAVIRPRRSSCGAQAAALAVTSVATEEAAYWYLLRFDEQTMTRADRQEFFAWMRRSPENIAELFNVAQLDARLRRLKLPPRTHALASDELRQQILKLYSKESRLGCIKQNFIKISLALLSSAAAALIGIGVALWVADSPNHKTFVTQAGQWEHTLLEDGTNLHVDARTRLEVDFTPHERLIRVYEGNAVFNVAKDPGRPFVVRTRFSDVTALGTRFGVSVENGVRTTVSEGTVRITAPGQTAEAGVTLRGGQQLFVSDGSFAKPVVSSVDAEQMLSWSTGWLDFRGETIGHAVEEFNRRNSVQIEIRSHWIASAKIHGRFRVDAPFSFVKTIAAPSHVRWIKDTSGKVVRLRLEDAQDEDTD